MRIKPEEPVAEKPQIKKGTLSLIMIIKDEEKNLSDCLKSTYGFADEIIVVDTGSSDNSVEIAKSFNAKVVHHKWNNDFSEARNVSIENAHSEWLLWTDADDRYTEASARAINRLKRNFHGRNTAFAFSVKNAEVGGTGGSFYQVRMFPNDPRLRFSRPIHEQISTALKAAKFSVIPVADVEVNHLGYLDEDLKKKKSLRNKTILEREVDNFREDPAFMSAMGDCYMVIGEEEKGIAAYKSVLSIPDCAKKQIDVFEKMPVNLATAYFIMKDYTHALEWLEKGLQSCPGKLELLYLAGEVHYATEQWGKATEALQQALKAPVRTTTTPSDTKGIRLKSMVLLGNTARVKKNYHEALRWYGQIKAESPNFHDIDGNIGEVYMEQKQIAKALGCFMESVKKFPGKDPRAYLHIGEIALAAGKKPEAKVVIEQGHRFFPADERITKLFIETCCF